MQAGMRFAAVLALLLACGGSTRAVGGEPLPPAADYARYFNPYLGPYPAQRVGFPHPTYVRGWAGIYHRGAGVQFRGSDGQSWWWTGHRGVGTNISW